MASRSLTGCGVAVVLPFCAGDTAAAGAARLDHYIRTTSPELRTLVSEGAAQSPTFRGLVERLARSNVLVYLEFDAAAHAPHGCLSLMASAGGYRYLLVRLRRVGTHEQQIALIGHELRHAVEIADAPAVVDRESLRMEYQRIGFVSRRSARPGLSFDTHAAIETGRRVLREIVRAADLGSGSSETD